MMSYCILTIKKPFARMANDEVFSDEKKLPWFDAGHRTSPAADAAPNLLAWDAIVGSSSGALI
jgi:hypothetical protein